MLILSGTITVAPEDVARITDAAIAMMEATRAEPGCLEYEFAEVIGAPGTIRVFERWATHEALEEHFAAPHLAVWQEALAGATVRARDLCTYEGIDAINKL